MSPEKSRVGRVASHVVRLVLALMIVLPASLAMAAGTPVGTVIQNTATVSFDLGGTPIVVNTNTVTITVIERIEFNVTAQTPQVLVMANDSDRELLFTITNTGNGTETFALAINSVVAGNDFDPVPAVPAIYFDTDGSGDLNVGDVPYNPGVNDPILAADEARDVFLVNNIPGTVVNGNVGRSELIATSTTGTGPPGTTFPGQGDGGTDAMVGISGGQVTLAAEYLVSDVAVNILKAQAVSDPFGGTEPVPGATITYTITVQVVGPGTTVNTVVRDPIPTYTTFFPGSIQLNGANLSDPIDADDGEIDTSVVPTVVVRLGDLDLSNGVQTVVFQVTID